MPVYHGRGLIVYNLVVILFAKRAIFGRKGVGSGVKKELPPVRKWGGAKWSISDHVAMGLKPIATEGATDVF